MTESDQDALLGKILRLRKEARERLALLTTEAEIKGRELSDLGHRLKSYPAYLFENELPANEPFRSAPQTSKWSSKSLVTADDIRRITSEIREAMARVAEFGEQLRRMGHDHS